MEFIDGYSRYECLLSGMAIFCSFGIKEDYPDELIHEKWINLQKQYPYLHDYKTIVEKGDNYSDNMPLKYKPIEQRESISDYLNDLMDFVSSETIKQEKLSKNNSLLSYARIQIKDIKYTIFSLSTSHCRTDFKAITFIATSFLNSFENITTIYPSEGMYSVLVEKKLIPDIKEREEIIQKYFNYKQPLKFDFTKLNENIVLTEEEKKIISNELKDSDKPIFFISRIVKFTKEEMKKLLSFCKKNELSIQALLDSAYLKASLELFQNNLKDADVVNFQIIYDQRKTLAKKSEKCIGLFVENTFPYFPINYINKSTIEIGKQLTERLKKTNSIDSEDFKRFRIEYYYTHEELFFIDYTLETSNIGKFKCMEDLSENLKEKFVISIF